MKRTPLLAAVALTLLLSVAAPMARAAPARDIPQFRDPVVASYSCGGCYEPSVTVDPKGRIFVTSSGAMPIGVSSDGGESFTHRQPPPVPIGSADGIGDAIVQIDPRGRLVYSQLVGTGVQIAISSNAGATWESNGFTGAPAGSPGADRQWIGFGPHKAVYAFWRTIGFVYWTATSTDGGATFGAAEPFLPGVVVDAIGPPVVDGKGRVYVPTITGNPLGPSSVGVAVSEAGVSTGSFTLREATTDYPSRFPILALDRRGMSLAWLGTDDGSRAIRVARSADGGRNWTAPSTISGLDHPTVSPWVDRHDGREDVSWFAVDSRTRARVMFARTTPGREPRTVQVAATTRANSDYSHFARLPDGRAVVVWSTDAVRVAVERS